MCPSKLSQLFNPFPPPPTNFRNVDCLGNINILMAPLSMLRDVVIDITFGMWAC